MHVPSVSVAKAMRRTRPRLRGIDVRPVRFLALFVTGAVAMALLTGIPTVLVPNDWLTRMTPIQEYAYPAWAASALLSGLLVASYGGLRAAGCSTVTGGGHSPGLLGATLTWFAVGCPICNKLVVAAVGVSGALTWFAPLQPWLAAASLLSLVGALAWRLRVLLLGCPQATAL